ncbi:MAG: ribonuclease P protein component [Flavobacteriaceae bacterium]|nr:ribonuclease P protein component [Flavobacteriaceae bacterium]
MQYTYKKEEKLKKRKLITQLFTEGSSVSEFPIKLIYLAFDHDSPYKVQAGVSVSKRNFKRAVDRNKIKRLLREVYRKNKHLIYQSKHTKKHIFMFIYVAKKEIEYNVLEENMITLLNKFLEKEIEK